MRSLKFLSILMAVLTTQVAIASEPPANTP